MNVFLLILFILLNSFIIIKDFKINIISDKSIIIILLMGVIRLFYTDIILYNILGAFFLSLPLYLLYLYNTNIIGGGDIKLLFVSGLFLGLKYMFFSWEIAMFFGLIFLVYLVVCKKIKKQMVIPLGSFIGLGNIIISLFVLFVGW